MALEKLFDRTREIRIDETQRGPVNERHYEFEPTYMYRGMTELHLEFTPA